jgi:hypothetical protein
MDLKVGAAFELGLIRAIWTVGSVLGSLFAFAIMREQYNGYRIWSNGNENKLDRIKKNCACVSAAEHIPIQPFRIARACGGAGRSLLIIAAPLSLGCS